MLLKNKKLSERGNIQPKIIFILLGIWIGYSYIERKDHNAAMQIREQQIQQSMASNPTVAISSIKTLNSSRNNTSPMTTQSAFKDLSQIRAQVDQLTSLDRRFQQAEPAQVFADSSHLSEQLESMSSIKSELIKLSVDDCLNKTKSAIQRAMQLHIDAYTAYLQYAKANEENFYSKLSEAGSLMKDAYKQMNICQNN